MSGVKKKAGSQYAESEFQVLGDAGTLAALDCYRPNEPIALIAASHWLATAGSDAAPFPPQFNLCNIRDKRLGSLRHQDAQEPTRIYQSESKLLEEVESTAYYTLHSMARPKDISIYLQRGTYSYVNAAQPHRIFFVNAPST